MADDEQEDIVARYRREQKQRKQVSEVTGVGLEFAVAVLLFTLIGYGIDRWLNSLPAATLVGFALGFTVAFYRIIKFSQRMNRK